MKVLKPLILKHTAYSVSVVGAQNDDEYKGRPRISSMSSKINGGVYCPRVMENQMEAIVVDYEKDAILRNYLEEMDLYIQTLAQRLHHAGRPMEFTEMISSICHKITADFPYSTRMLDKNYNKRYVPGSKVHLGALMTNQDMVCRHMGLLMGAMVDYCKEKFYKNLPGVKFKSDTEMRFMGDMQMDVDEKEQSGHAYLVIRKPMKKTTGNYILVVDPANGRVVDLNKLIASKGPKNALLYRYVFSALRFMLQDKNSQDDQLLEKLFLEAKTDSTMLSVIKNLNKSLQTPEAITNYIALLARLNLKGLV